MKKTIDDLKAEKARDVAEKEEHNNVITSGDVQIDVDVNTRKLCTDKIVPPKRRGRTCLKQLIESISKQIGSNTRDTQEKHLQPLT